MSPRAVALSHTAASTFRAEKETRVDQAMDSEGSTSEPSSPRSGWDCTPLDNDVVDASPAPRIMSPMPSDENAAAVATEGGRPETADEFVLTFKKTLQPPLILSTPRVRVTRARMYDEFIPKCSERLAVKSIHRDLKPEAQARKVMMKRLGLKVETERLDEASFDEFQTAITMPQPEDTREAMNVLFPGRKQRTYGPLALPETRTCVVHSWFPYVRPQLIFLECTRPELKGAS